MAVPRILLWLLVVILIHISKVSAQACKDDNTHCQAWKDRGECDINPDYMGLHCAVSCGRCTVAPECKDSDVQCVRWAGDGECTSNPRWMQKKCPVSCRTCDCKNIKDTATCEGWADGDDDQCVENPIWMAENCKLACGKCLVSSDSTTASTTATTAKTSTTNPVTTSTATTTSSPTGQAAGVYLTNETHIILNVNGRLTPIITEGTKSVVGLAVDLDAGLLFWSDIGYKKKGIYKANMDGTGAQHIIATDILEPNGLAVDWISKNLYWTDAQTRRIEVADYLGNNRRTLVSTDLFLPRGIVADPINGNIPMSKFPTAGNLHNWTFETNISQKSFLQQAVKTIYNHLKKVVRNMF